MTVDITKWQTEPSKSEGASLDQQREVFDKAIEIFLERQALYQNNWARFDEGDALHHMQSKLSRLEIMIDDLHGPEDIAIGESLLKLAILDNALDLINFTAFLIRHITGAKPSVQGINEP